MISLDTPFPRSRDRNACEHIHEESTTDDSSRNSLLTRARSSRDIVRTCRAISKVAYLSCHVKREARSYRGDTAFRNIPSSASLHFPGPVPSAHKSRSPRPSRPPPAQPLPPASSLVLKEIDSSFFYDVLSGEVNIGIVVLSLAEPRRDAMPPSTFHPRLALRTHVQLATSTF